MQTITRPQPRTALATTGTIESYHTRGIEVATLAMPVRFRAEARRDAGSPAGFTLDLAGEFEVPSVAKDGDIELVFKSPQAARSLAVVFTRLADEIDAAGWASDTPSAEPVA